MDPLSIATATVTLYGVVAQLSELGKRYRYADATLAEIQDKCNQALNILCHFEGQLKERRQLLQAHELHSIQLETSLEKSCNDLVKQVTTLLSEIDKLSFTPATRGELLVSFAKRYKELRRFQHAHATLEQKLKDFQNQKAWLDSDNFLILIRRASEPSSVPASHPQRCANDCVRTSSSTSAHSAPANVDFGAHDLRRKRLFEAIRSSKYNVVQMILEGADLDLDDSSPSLGDMPAVILAVLSGNIEIFKLVLQHKFEINSRDSEGQTALHKALMCKADDMVELLLQADVNLLVQDKYGHTPLWYAASGRSTYQSFKILLEAHAHIGIDESRDDDIPTPLWAATAYGYLDRASALLEQGANANSVNGKHRTLLHQIEWSNGTKFTQLLLDYGADPWATDLPHKKLPLHRAAEHGQINAATRLLKRMFEQQGQDMAEIVDIRDANDTTPLMYAALNGSLSLVVYLTRTWKAKLDLQTKDGNDAFYCACAKGHTPIAIFLLGLGANSNRGNQHGDTPLHIAAAQGHQQTVEMLLQIGANKEAKSRRVRDGWITQGVQERTLEQLVTPYQAARLAGHTGIAQIIEEFEANGLEDA